ncbi:MULTISPECIES: helix-turn-helix domain-containing protein [Salinibaculum]|uniref:helix-turn-helix domain-containing protein n=1 Tax=Salinibaculum TaxID=2732368 RepID=UPI0030D3B88B
MFSGNDFEFNLSARDVAILKARVKYPEKPVSELRDILEAEFGISLSHNRVNEILNEMKAEDIFSMQAVPNRNIFEYYLFQVAFHYSNFDENWERCYKKLLDDPHVVMFCSADDYHEWQFVAQFASPDHSEEWRHEFVKEYGEFIAQIDKTAFPTVHKFETAAAVFDDLLHEMDGEEFLEKAHRVDGQDATDRVSINQ